MTDTRFLSLAFSVAGYSVVGFLILGSGAGCVTRNLYSEERSFEHRFESASGRLVKFETLSGSIDVETHAGDFVHYNGTLTFRGPTLERVNELFDALEPSFRQEDGVTLIALGWKNGRRPRSTSSSGRHVLLIPSDGSIELYTAGGAIRASDLGGDATVKTSGGSIRLGRIGGEVRARTSGGGITVTGANGNVDVNTTGGEITLGDINGAVIATTSGGRIKIDKVRGSLKARTSGGSIRATLVEQVDEDVTLSTSGGSVTLSVPSDFRAVLDAKTSGGSASCDLPILVQGKQPRNRVVGELNGGGPRVILRSSGGNVRLQEI